MSLSYFGKSKWQEATGKRNGHQHHPSIAITQPRRLPCVSLAQRVSEEMGVRLGDQVGYAVRFESKERLGRPKGNGKLPSTNVRFCTEGVLLR